MSRRNGKIVNRRISRRRRRWKIIKKFIIALLLLAALGYFVYLCQSETIEISGNTHYAAEDIKREIFSNEISKNTLYQRLMGLLKKEVELPYLTTYEVKYPSLNKMQVVVYEKEAVAFVEHEDSYVLFDKQGIVLRIETEVPEGIPRIEGLELEEVKVFDKISVTDASVFNMIKNLVAQLRKNSLNPDKIVITEKNHMDMYFGKIIVKMGTDDALENKIDRFMAIYPNIEGKSGILYLDEANETTDKISFIKTK